jgi:hypothetical protein
MMGNLIYIFVLFIGIIQAYPFQNIETEKPSSFFSTNPISKLLDTASILKSRVEEIEVYSKPKYDRKYGDWHTNQKGPFSLQDSKGYVSVIDVQ